MFRLAYLMQPFSTQNHSVEIGAANRHFATGIDGIVVKIGTQNLELSVHTIIRSQPIDHFEHPGRAQACFSNELDKVHACMFQLLDQTAVLFMQQDQQRRVSGPGISLKNNTQLHQCFPLPDGHGSETNHDGPGFCFNGSIQALGCAADPFFSL